MLETKMHCFQPHERCLKYLLGIKYFSKTIKKPFNAPKPSPYTPPPPLLSITVNRLKGENNVLGMLVGGKHVKKFTSRRSFLLSAAA